MEKHSEYPRFYYKHDSEPELRFWYPIATPENAEASPRDHSDTNFLSCHTRRLRSLSTCVTLPREGMRVSLQTSDGIRAGHITCLSAASKSVNSNGLEEELTSESVELIELSRGIAHGQRSYRLEEFDYHHRLPIDENSRYHFYSVMCIEWEDGVAYRRGLGRVPAELWETEELEEIHVMLG